MIPALLSASVAGLRCRTAIPPDALRRRDVIVMLHGIGGSGRQLAPLAQSMDHGLSPVLIDLPGHGESPTLDDDEPEALLGKVLDTIDTLEARAVWLLGHSFGGFLALMAASVRPHAFAGLILIATTSKLRLHPELIERAAAGAFDLDWVRATTGPEVGEDGVQIVYEDFTRLRLPHGRSSLEKWAGLDLRPCLDQIDLPALVIKPDADLIISPRHSTSLTRSMPNARLLSIPRAGHYVALARPALLGRAVSSFTRRHAAAAHLTAGPLEAAR